MRFEMRIRVSCEGHDIDAPCVAKVETWAPSYESVTTGAVVAESLELPTGWSVRRGAYYCPKHQTPDAVEVAIAAAWDRRR